jgi:hypothetical protein
MIATGNHFILIRCAERHGHPPQRGGSTFPFGEGVSPNGLTDEVIPNPSAKPIPQFVICNCELPNSKL